MTEAPTPLPTRPSDTDRERVVRVLQDEAVRGRVSPETLSRRLELAYQATSEPQLAAAVEDLQDRGRLGSRLIAVVAWASETVRSIELAWQRPRLQRLVLPAGPRPLRQALVLGRARDCDFVLHHRTVSLRHPTLHRGELGWVLHDLRSTNGTLVNGCVVTTPTVVRSGNRVSFGGCSVILREP